MHKNQQRIHIWNAFCWHAIDFWLIFWSRGASQNVPAALQKPPIFSSIFGCLRKSARIGPWEAPGRPKASPRHLQRSILSRFWIDFPGGFPCSLFRRSNEFLHEVFAFVFFSWTFSLCVTDFPDGFPHLLFQRSNDFLHEVFAFVFFSWTFCLCVTLIRATEKLY